MPAFGPTSTTDSYVQIGGNAGFLSGTLNISTAGVDVILMHAPPGMLQLATEDEPVFISPANGAGVALVGTPVDLIIGFKIRSHVAGMPAVFSGSLIPYGKAGISGGGLFSGTLSPGGVLTPVSNAGTELAYAQFTANVNIVGTTEPNATIVVTAPSFTFDGSTVAVIEADIPGMLVGTSTLYLVLFDNGVSIGQLTYLTTGSAGDQIPVHRERRLTPSAAAHVYSVRSFTANADGIVAAGPGGLGQLLPGFIRVVQG